MLFIVVLQKLPEVQRRIVCPVPEVGRASASKDLARAPRRHRNSDGLAGAGVEDRERHGVCLRMTNERLSSAVPRGQSGLGTI